MSERETLIIYSQKMSNQIKRDGVPETIQRLEDLFDKKLVLKEGEDRLIFGVYDRTINTNTSEK